MARKAKVPVTEAAKRSLLRTVQNECKHLLREIGRRERAVLRRQAKFAQKIQELKESTDGQVTPLLQERELLMDQLQSLATDYRDLLTEAAGKQTIILTTGEFAWDTWPNKVVFRSSDAAVVEELRAHACSDLVDVETKETVKKSEINRNPERVEGFETVEVVRTKVFVAKPDGVKEPIVRELGTITVTSQKKSSRLLLSNTAPPSPLAYSPPCRPFLLFKIAFPFTRETTWRKILRKRRAMRLA